MVIPKVKVLEESDEKVSLQIEGIDRSYANAIRRFCISEVPAMAIDDIVILENSSVLYDEILAHRLGMIPLRTDLERYVLPEKCDCGNPLGCQKCRVLIVLDAVAHDKSRTVLSGDLVSEDREIRPVSANIPIVKLAAGQSVKLEAYARLGRAREHAKWQPATISVLLDGKPEGSFILKVESSGSMPAKEIVTRAIEKLQEKFQDLHNEVTSKVEVLHNEESSKSNEVK
jgi:DNA-directed RNA polymerase subunit D